MVVDLNKFVGIVHFALAVLLTIFLLVILIFMGIYAYEYDFSTGPLYGHVIYWVIPLVPLTAMVFGNFILYKYSLLKFKS